MTFFSLFYPSIAPLPPPSFFFFFLGGGCVWVDRAPYQWCKRIVCKPAPVKTVRDGLIVWEVLRDRMAASVLGVRRLDPFVSLSAILLHVFPFFPYTAFLFLSLSVGLTRCFTFLTLSPDPSIHPPTHPSFFFSATPLNSIPVRSEECRKGLTTWQSALSHLEILWQRGRLSRGPSDKGTVSEEKRDHSGSCRAPQYAFCRIRSPGLPLAL